MSEDPPTYDHTPPPEPPPEGDPQLLRDVLDQLIGERGWTERFLTPDAPPTARNGNGANHA